MRGPCVPVGPVATTLSALPTPQHHRPRSTSQAGPRRTPRLDLGTTWLLPSMWRNLHHPSHLVVALRPVQPSISTTSLGIELPSERRLGAGRSAVPRSQ